MSMPKDNKHSLDGAKRLLSGIEAGQSALHSINRYNALPPVHSPADSKAIARIKRRIAATIDELEDIRLTLDEWIIDYDEWSSGR